MENVSDDEEDASDTHVTIQDAIFLITTEDIPTLSTAPVKA